MPQPALTESHMHCSINVAHMQKMKWYFYVISFWHSQIQASSGATYVSLALGFYAVQGKFSDKWHYYEHLWLGNQILGLLVTIS